MFTEFPFRTFAANVKKVIHLVNIEHETFHCPTHTSQPHSRPSLTTVRSANGRTIEWKFAARLISVVSFSAYHFTTRYTHPACYTIRHIKQSADTNYHNCRDRFSHPPVDDNCTLRIRVDGVRKGPSNCGLFKSAKCSGRFARILTRRRLLQLSLSRNLG